MACSFRQVLQTYSEICLFCSVIQYIVSKKQPVRSAHEVLAESLKTVFNDEAHFIVNLHNFLQPFLPHPSRQNNFQNSSPLDKSETALVWIFSSIPNHR